MSEKRFLTPEVWEKYSSQTKSLIPRRKSQLANSVKEWVKKRIWHFIKEAFQGG